MTSYQESVRFNLPGTPRKRFALRLLAAAAAASGAMLGGASYAHASVYNVYTSTKSAMLVSKDGYCSLAEAVNSANAGHSLYTDCPDGAPGGSQTIQLVEAPGMPFSNHHYKITTLTVSSPYVALVGLSSRAKVDSTGLSGIIINAGASMTFFAVDLTYTGGASGGRLVENRGTMDMYAATLSNGNVTAHTYGLGGAIYNEGTITYLGSDVQLLNNKAKRGGAIYNKDGRISNLDATISGNSALAGGGIYNMATMPRMPGDFTPKARIDGDGATITRNSAKAGGGIFNRGEVFLTGSAITFNTASGTGSGENCADRVPCDGNGGGVLNLPSTTWYAKLSQTAGSTLSDNTASGLGGAAYSRGILNFSGVTIARNKARSGGVFYAVADGPSYYCSVAASSGTGDSLIFDNSTVPSGGFSIVDAEGPIQCTFGSSSDQEQVFVWGNVYPFCKPDSVNPACPQ